MKEDFLHHVWQFKKFNVLDLKTVRGEDLVIINAGQYLEQAGPDFFNAQIVIEGQKWAGNVEIHLRSSDWYIHRHETDPNYHNVVLHVVWEHDTEVFRQDNTEVPVLELKNYVDASLLSSYNVLSAAKSWIYCEKELESLNGFVLENWKERLLFERLERKSQPILEHAKSTANDWESVLFSFLAKGFGLNTNGASFWQLAEAIPFTVLRKESTEAENLEALFFGRLGWLKGDFEDSYCRDLKGRYGYMAHKHQLKPVYVDDPQFFKHRPDNFPTVRLPQLAQLYHRHQNLFAKIIEAADIEAVYEVFKVGASPYWQTHYRFDKESPKKRKELTRSFIDLLIINVIVPFRFAYGRSIGHDNSEELMGLLRAVSPENNGIIDKFRQFKVGVDSAYDSQSLLQLRNEYCAHKRCMHCALGLELLKK